MRARDLENEDFTAFSLRMGPRLGGGKGMITNLGRGEGQAAHSEIEVGT